MSQFGKDVGILQNIGRGLKITFTEKGTPRTKQAAKKECDINVIMEKYRSTGSVPVTLGKTGKYGDFSEVDDYHSAFNKVMEANESFNQLPAHVRSKFRNDPALLIEYLNDPKNTLEAVKLGILPRSALKASQGTSSESPAATKAKTSTDAKKAATKAADTVKDDAKE